MIVLDYIREIKKHMKPNTATFSEALSDAKQIDFPNKDTILTHFESINIKEKDSFIHLKYNVKKMFKQPWDEFYMKTRALVIDWKEEEIVLYPFDKFFELDEHQSSTLKKVKERMKQATYTDITEKIDGSLIAARYYKGTFFVVSSGSLEGLHVDIAKNILHTDHALQESIKQHPNHTFILEMKNSQIPQLIKYKEDKLTIIGMRDMNTLTLLNRNEIKELTKKQDVSIAPTFDLSVEDMLRIMEDPNTSNNEGYILRIDDFLVKMKTKNFIMANRFAGEPSRNFNMIVEAINEGRTASIRPMIKENYLESYDILLRVIKGYADEKENTLRSMYEQIDENLEMSEFIVEAQRRFHPYVKHLISLKNNHFQRLPKKDVTYLKKFAPYFTCVSHFMYAELNGLQLADVVSDIESGKIKYLKKYYDSYNKVDVYIIHKWQWINFDDIKPFT